jgi:hypothetical protein
MRWGYLVGRKLKHLQIYQEPHLLGRGLEEYAQVMAFTATLFPVPVAPATRR